MHESRPSRTALRVAMRRAAHQLFDHPAVFEDPFALKILGSDYAERVRSGRWESSRFAAAMRAFMAVRSRYAEDQLSEAVEREVRQYVILGAGLDTFAYRNPHAGAGLRVSGLAFDYAVPRESLGWMDRLAFDALSAQVKMSGEPFRSFFSPVELAHELQSMGFRRVEDLTPEETNARYFPDRADGLRVSGKVGRLMSAAT